MRIIPRGFAVLVSLCAIAGAQAQDSLNLRTVGAMALDGPNNLSVYRRHLFAGQLHTGWRVIDVTNPQSPAEDTLLLHGRRPTGSDFAGDYAYVADWLDAVYTVDLSDPCHPAQVAFTPDLDAETVDVSGDYAYVAAGNTGLVVVNIAAPQNPVIVDSLNLADYALMGIVVGNYVYLLNGMTTLITVDVTSPSQPVIMDSCTVHGYHHRMVAAHGYLYVAADTAGVAMISLTDPAHPALTGYYRTPHIAYDVAAWGDFLAVADDSAALLLNLESPAAPVEVGYYRQRTYDSPSVCMDSSFLYLAKGGVLRVMDYSAAQDVPKGPLSGPREFVLHPAYPNPFNSSTTVSFELPVTREVCLDVFDIMGRRVMTLAYGVYAAGVHTQTLDGSKIASGIYIIRLHTGMSASSQKIVLLK